MAKDQVLAQQCSNVSAVVAGLSREVYWIQYPRHLRILKRVTGSLHAGAHVLRTHILPAHVLQAQVPRPRRSSNRQRPRFPPSATTTTANRLLTKARK